MNTQEIVEALEQGAVFARGANPEIWRAAAEIVRAFGMLEEAVQRGKLFVSYYHYSDGRRVNIGLTNDSNEDREGKTLLEAIQSTDHE